MKFCTLSLLRFGVRSKSVENLEDVKTGLLILESGRYPVVQSYIELLLRLARYFYHFLIGQSLVLVEGQR